MNPTQDDATQPDATHTAPAGIRTGSIFVDGDWTEPVGTGRIPVVDPTTERIVAEVPDGTVEDADRAVAAARRAFDAAPTAGSWAATTPAERADVLRAVADGLEARRDELARCIATEVGMPLRLADAIQVGMPIATLRATAELVTTYRFEEEVGSSLVVREPVGVVAAITPWNYPLHQLVAKLAPALAAGCTVVAKPSEVAPLNAYVLFEEFARAGLPAGVANLVTGVGPVVGERLAGHRDVDMVSFTGSTRAGRRVAELASANVTRVTLELGGKSPNVICDDLDGDDFARAVRSGVSKAFLNSGQTCSALTRMLVPSARLAEAEEIAGAAAEAFTVGDPFGDAKLGPLVSAAQRERVRAHIRTGEAEGARLVTGGADAPDDRPRGWFVQPTVFSDVRNDMTIAREEIFGPVLVLIGYDDEDDAVRIANDSDYGLAAAVWSADPARADRLARRLRAGQVEVNGGRHNPLAPFGGYGHSGIGREFGRWGLEEFLEVKSLQR